MSNKHEFTVGIYRADEYQDYGELNMPFTFYEYQDALEKARFLEGHTPVTIEFTYIKQDCLRFLFDMGDGTFENTNDLLELNLLSQQLAEMDIALLDCFEAQVRLEQKNPNPGESIPLARLINLTYQTSDCLPAYGIHSNAELGRFLFENDMLSDDEYNHTTALEERNNGKIPVEWLTLIGRQHLEDHNGVITKQGYFECPEEIPETYKRGEMDYFNQHSAPVILEIGNPFSKNENGKFMTICLPANNIELNHLLICLLLN